jgi:hypothetical protein
MQRLMVGALALGAVVFLGGASSFAADDDHKCSMRQVAGAYGLNFESQGGSPVFPPGGENQPFASTARIDLNTDGTWTAEIETYIILDTVAPSEPIVETVEEGTWEVDDNCLGRLDFIGVEGDFDASFVVADNGEQLFIAWAFIGESDAYRLFPDDRGRRHRDDDDR